MAENRKIKMAPSQQGGYGAGIKANTRSVIQGRNARNPIQARVVAPATSYRNNPANRRRQ